MSSDFGRIEDYGGPADEDAEAADQEDQGQGQRSGGSQGVSRPGEQFGEFGNTGTGTDLTEEMENSDVRSGLVKGGEEGADDVAGPAQYGGDAGSLRQDRSS